MKIKWVGIVHQLQWFFFDNVKVPKENLIGKEGGFKIALSGLDGGRINIAACSLGAAHRCLEDAMKYVQERKAFNQTIASFQNTQFKIANLATDLHSSRLLLRNAANLFDNNHPDKTMYCAMAKKYVTDKGFDICNESLQLLGGYGYLADYNIERFVRDVRVNQILEGTNEIMQFIVARRLMDQATQKQ